MEIQNNNQTNQNPKSPEAEQARYGVKKYWKFVLGFLAIIVLAAGGFFVWEKYFSPAAKLERQNQENYQKYLNWQANYENAMKNDTYGGKTPEETLKMFIEALKKEDIELASKYFILREDGTPDPKWREALKQKKETGQLSNIIDIVSRVVPDKETTTIENSAWFVVYKKDNTKELEADINLHFNTYSGIWKIESL